MNGSSERLQAYVDAGWTVAREGRGHTILRCPCGKHQTAVSRSNNPRDWRAQKNNQREINKCRRGL